MKLLKRQSKSIWCVYDLQYGRWQEKAVYHLLGQAAFYDFLMKRTVPFDFALIDLDVTYRNTLYVMEPHIKPIIMPAYLTWYMRHFFDLKERIHPEVAISLDEALTEQQQALTDFLVCFYQSKTLEQARKCYEDWQIERCIVDEIGTKLQTMIQIFEAEIFNYFIYEPLLEEMMRP